MCTPNPSCSGVYQYLSQLHASVLQFRHVPWKVYTTWLLIKSCDKKMNVCLLEYSCVAFLGHTRQWKKPKTIVFMLYTFILQHQQLGLVIFDTFIFWIQTHAMVCMSLGAEFLKVSEFVSKLFCISRHQDSTVHFLDQQCTLKYSTCSIQSVKFSVVRWSSVQYNTVKYWR